MGCVSAGCGGAGRLGCAVPTGAFHGFDGVGAACGDGDDCGIPPGITNGVEAEAGPGAIAGTGKSPAAAAAAIAGSLD
jgi:hypothetical protein